MALDGLKPREKMADLFQRFESYDGHASGGATSSLSSTNPFDVLEPSSAITESVARSVSWVTVTMATWRVSLRLTWLHERL